MVTSACLPIVADSEFQGVTCMDIPIDTMFSPIIDFHLGRLSYAFLIDSRGRVLLHPLLPKPENYKHEPIFLDMESVEISDATGSVKASMIRSLSLSVLLPPHSHKTRRTLGRPHLPATKVLRRLSE